MWVSRALRLLVALSIVGVAGWTGFVHRSPWIVLPLSLAFTVLYVAGKWRTWRRALRGRGLGATLINLLATWPAQVVLAGLCYLVGFGLGALVTDRPTMPELTPFDWWLAAALVLIAVPTTALIEWLEARDGTGALDEIGAGIADLEHLVREHDANERDADATARSDEGIELDIDPTPITPDTFFSAWTSPERIDPPASEQDIAEAERRLGVELPEMLRALYRRRNGGNTDAIWVPLVPDPRPRYDDWRACFAHDYDALLSLDNVTTLREAYLNWVDPDDPEEAATIPDGAERRIVLAMRYEDTTFLDYTRPGPPRVGVVDFEQGGPEDAWFDDFETFLGALRRERATHET